MNKQPDKHMRKRQIRHETQTRTLGENIQGRRYTKTGGAETEHNKDKWELKPSRGEINNNVQQGVQKVQTKKHLRRAEADRDKHTHLRESTSMLAGSYLYHLLPFYLIYKLDNKPDFKHHNLPVSLEEPRTKATYVAV